MIIFKSDFANYQQCIKRVWLSRYATDKTRHSIDPYLATFGDIVGRRAREWAKDHLPSTSGVPTFISVDGRGRHAVEHTKALLKAGTNLLFEPAFIHNEVYCRADVLWNRSSSQIIAEVKSSTSIEDDTDATKKYGLDLAVQYYAMTDAMSDGDLNISSFQLLTLDPQTSGVGIDGLNFRRTEMLPAIREMQSSIGVIAEEIQDLLSSPYEPEINMGLHCKKNGGCPFITHCKQGSDDLFAFELPGYAGNWRKIPKLEKTQYPLQLQTPVAQIADDLLPNKLFKTIQLAERNQQHSLNIENSQQTLRKHRPPYGYLDFEFTALPYSPAEGISVGERIPFQYVLYRKTTDTDLKPHVSEYLNIEDPDPRRAFAEKLIADCTGLNTIFVYNKAAEAGIIKQLIRIYPDLNIQLSDILIIMVDLLDVVRENYYHPDMMGSYSLKKVLPTIGITYDDLPLQGGNDAQLNYLMARYAPENLTSPLDVIKTRLSAYCDRDTFGLVKLHEFLLTGCGAVTPRSTQEPKERNMNSQVTSSAEDNSPRFQIERRLPLYYIFAIFSAVVLIWLVIAPIVFHFFGQPRGSAELGNSFGVAESLFSALGLAGIILSIILQQRDARLTRNEVAESAVAQKMSARALEKQAELHALTTRIQALAVLIESANQQINQNDRWNSSAGEKKFDSTKIFQKRRQAEAELWRLKEQLDLIDREADR